MKMIFIFIDGFGIGDKNPDKNPIYAAKAPNILDMFERFSVYPTDASLGVPGLPQSATGQTAIFTGENGSKAIGNHLSGQPTETLKNIIYEKNIFKELIKRGFSVVNANVYRDEYLKNIQNPKDRLHRPSVTTVMTYSAGVEFTNVQKYKQGLGVYHDITGQIIKSSGYDVETITPEAAAGRLYNLSRNYDFTMYEHFMSDLVGHTTDMKLAIEEIELLDAFLGELLKLVDLKDDIIFITSDHGNIEDISVKTHTMNKVPTVIIGRDVPEVHIETLTDIMPAVLEIFDLRR